MIPKEMDESVRKLWSSVTPDEAESGLIQEVDNDMSAGHTLPELQEVLANEVPPLKVAAWWHGVTRR